ncbi:metal-dependent hydrolase [Nitrosomonas sp. Is37]|uniref:metal-dependent hydrolase n=1 Tax=Nitrosomonas sp. Is37 TaxID=3080535 RepID=UPI00294AF888|nr:metal-dependent hydrolase [Nitrosomonas sp. Is37]MDV6344205.1 metal-dependent hydrolase [Nitrosomonas sp. Is37]
MDTLTHALSSALLVRAAEPVLPKLKALPVRTRLIAGMTAAAFPDIDGAIRLIDTLTYLNWHQGLTHSLLMLPLWAFFLSYLFSKVARGRYSWQLFLIPASLGIAIHIAEDLITSYGLMLLAPFSTERFSMPLAFVIDSWFSAIIIVGLVMSYILPAKKYIAGFALVCLSMYVVFLAFLHEQAKDIGLAYAQKMALADAEINVLPQPFSPFNWKIVAVEGETYHILLVKLASGSSAMLSDNGVLSKMLAVYQPLTSAKWQQLKRFGDFPVDTALVREAWYQPALADFRQFAVFPQLDRIDYSEKGVCIWFYDLRFKFPLLPPSFRYGGCREEESANWYLQRQKGAFWID